MVLLADNRDCGRRRPEFIVLWPRVLALLAPNVGDGIEDGPGRNAVGADGLETRRRSLSFWFGGDGESSMIRTHPDESPGSLFVSSSLSPLRLESALRLLERLSQLVFAVEALLEDEDEDEGPELFITVDEASELVLGRPVILPIRNRGTRVWIFCSKLRTRARISDTI